jgi:Cys-tRNA(Pro)/Cys-tRNA(Cys) deacylase
VTTLLDRQGGAYRLHSYTHDLRADSYGTEAVEALGVAMERVFKTLVADVEGRLVVGVVPISAQLDLRALAAAVGAKKGRMAQVASAERATGYVAGGSPRWATGNGCRS